MSAALSEKIYAQSPVAVQNFMSSLYGLHLRHQRYGGRFKSYLAELLKTQWFDEEQLRQLQLDSLRKLIAHAFEKVPFYRAQFAGLGLQPGDIKGISDLGRLPLLTKQAVLQRYDDFLATGLSRKDLLVITTGGTTGTPLQVLVTTDARRRNYAFFARSKLWAGVGVHERSATFAGRVVVPHQQSTPPFWRSNFFCHNTQFSSFHISPHTARAYYEKLKALRPALIDSYPSSIYFLAKFMREQGLTDIRPKAIITASETLFDHQRACIEEVFGCKVYSQYGLSEPVAFVCQCERGSHHVNPEYGIVELLDEQGRPVAPSQPGEVVATGFTNPALPLIRYRTGDIAVASGEPCGCGRSFPVWSEILGRSDDSLMMRDGRRIPLLGGVVFKGLGHTVTAAQIVQNNYDNVTLRIERGTGYRESDGLRVVGELKKRLGAGVRVDIQYADRIARTAGGKYRVVICNIANDTAGLTA